MTTDILSTLGLGAIITWDLQGTRITPSDLRTVLAAEGLTAEAAAVPDIDLRNAAKRAAREWSQGRGNAARYRAEVVREDGGSVQVGILRHERVSQDEVRWVQVDTLTLDLATGTWTAANGLAEGADLIAHATERATYLDHSYVRPELLQAKMTAWRAFPLRRQGGAYFVAGAYDAELQALQRVVGKLGDSVLSMFHLAQSAQTTQALEQGAREHAGTTLRTLRSKLQGWQDRAGSVRSDAVAGMLEELKVLRGDVQFYSDSLQVALDDVMADLDSAVADAQALARAEFDAEPGAEVVRARTERSVRGDTVARWQAAIAAAPVVDGVVVIDAELGAVHGLPASAFRWPAVHSRNEALNARILGPMGLRSRLVDGAVHVSQSSTVNEPVATVEAAPVAPVVAEQAPVQPEPEFAVPAQVVVYDESALDEMPMKDAIKVAKGLGVKGTARLGKAQLVQAILAAQA